MQSSFAKLVIGVLVFLGIIWGGVFFFFKNQQKHPVPSPLIVQPVVTKQTNPVYSIIGRSVQGRKIESYTYGNGHVKLVFVGGMHGGYEWNSVLLAYRFIDYLSADATAIPANIKVIVIPDLNPDAVFKVTGKEGRFTQADVSTNTMLLASARFNADGVDLNRNFGCNWQPKSTWQNKIVSAGTSAFSEPETQAIKNFVTANNPNAFVFWHSQANAVYASECNNGILPETLDVMNSYAKAAGYPAVKSFDAYSITGDSEGWLASISIPAITVELKTHKTLEWDKNLAGIEGLFNYFSKK